MLRERPRLLMALRIVACAYVLVIGWIVHLANSGRLPAALDACRHHPYGDKIGHFLLAGGLSFLVNMVLRNRQWRIARFRVQVGTVLVLGAVVLEELAQIRIPARSFDLLDLGADFLGIMLFGALAGRVVGRDRVESDRGRDSG